MSCKEVKEFIKRALFFAVLFIDAGFLATYYALRKIIITQRRLNGPDLWSSDMVVIFFIVSTVFLALLAYTSRD
ncbi:hypothetical protein [Thermococcus stetteri]|uniref:hypothetical protein n=1 Tax=Thermococcus stetteri TaxID=49900 RepID=UPI001AEBA1D1|nr:hypothetical protein [Thermococcus stetteri]MBP1911505.1 hypothetical protein [Thermococcus stetteri]